MGGNLHIGFNQTGIYDAKYQRSILSVSGLMVADNRLVDGIITMAGEIEFNNNRIELTTYNIILGKQWENVKIKGNEIVVGGNRRTKHTSMFIIDSSDKDASYDTKRILIKNNQIIDGNGTSLVTFTGTDNCPQLKRIK